MHPCNDTDKSSSLFAALNALVISSWLLPQARPQPRPKAAGQIICYFGRMPVYFGENILSVKMLAACDKIYLFHYFRASFRISFSLLRRLFSPRPK